MTNRLTIDPTWTFIRYGTVAGWMTVAIYRKPDGSTELVRV